jgi:hypothetical protein
MSNYWEQSEREEQLDAHWHPMHPEPEPYRGRAIRPLTQAEIYAEIDRIVAKRKKEAEEVDHE